jgi:hypothetical protein
LTALMSISPNVIAQLERKQEIELLHWAEWRPSFGKLYCVKAEARADWSDKWVNCSE